MGEESDKTAGTGALIVEKELVEAPAEDGKTAEVEKVSDIVATDAAGAPSKLEHDIIRQVEYYFGDANLNRDKFLLTQIEKDENGWVPFSVLITFKRLASLTEDIEVIVNALMKSDEGLIEISDDKKKIRRHPERPIPEYNEERRKDVMARTAYAKGFPLDMEMSDLLSFFSDFDTVVNVVMRKYLDKASKTYKFKGSIFVTFEQREQAEEFINKDRVVCKEREIIRLWQDKYLDDKKKEPKLKKGKKQAAEEVLKLPKGAVVHFQDVTDEVTREMLRWGVEDISGGDFEVAYVCFSKGDKDGHIRFKEENAACKFVEKLQDNKLKLKNGDELTIRLLRDEEETEYLNKAADEMSTRRKTQKNKGGRKRRGFGYNGNDRSGAKKPRNE
ncbi:la protein homolog [Teleopsis dalmanni]|uniref:la protein homolog n=1 Tax=Teleopsis dalmanni TaxID=139649 RepID=UPI000D32D2E4|nr:la protein homolog [Teleopsis dalmanni]